MTDLSNINPGHVFFAGIDSDGCVFDTMDLKQKEFFIPNALEYFNLKPVENVVRETWEFVNLYSVYRGGNRYISLVRVFEYLSRRTEVMGAGIQLPDLTMLKKWISQGTRLGLESLKEFGKTIQDPGIETVVKWSEAVNQGIEQSVSAIPAFKNAIKAIQLLSGKADIVVVSQTPRDAIEREWKANDLTKYLTALAGQEQGTKKEQLALAAVGRYPSSNILLIGDAIGDLDAAKENNVLFYPVIPGNEEASWERFIEEGMHHFFNGKFSGAYEEMLIAEFRKHLPELPSWR